MDEEAKAKLFALTFVLLSIATNAFAASVLKGCYQPFFIGYAAAVLSILFGTIVAWLIKGVDTDADEESRRIFIVATTTISIAVSSLLMLVMIRYLSVYLRGYLFAIAIFLLCKGLVEWASKDEDD